MTISRVKGGSVVQVPPQAKFHWLCRLKKRNRYAFPARRADQPGLAQFHAERVCRPKMSKVKIRPCRDPCRDPAAGEAYRVKAIVGALFLKHLVQHNQHSVTAGRLQFAKTFDDALFINCPNLVEYDLPLYALKGAFDA